MPRITRIVRIQVSVLSGSYVSGQMCMEQDKDAPNY